MGDEQLLEQVRALRVRGYSPKAIARALGVRPARVAPMVRALATQEAAAAPEPGLLGCWVSPGWSVGLTLPRRHGWPDRRVKGPETQGVVSVLVAREGRRGGDTSVCGYLVDTYCLGVKNALGPRRVPRAGLDGLVAAYFRVFPGGPVAAPIGLARELVWGAIAYARGLGFEPHRDFGAAGGHLGPLEAPSTIGFGQRGRPHYMAGPYDDVGRIMRTLDERVGRDNYHFTVPLTDEVAAVLA